MNRNDWIRQRAGRAQGITVAELRAEFPDMTPTFACNVMYVATKLKAQPLLPAKVKGHKHRWFLHEHDRAHYLESTPVLDWQKAPVLPERRAVKNQQMAAWREKRRAEKRQHQAQAEVLAPKPRPAAVSGPQFKDAPITGPLPEVKRAVTPPGRFEVIGPLHSVVDPRECRGWAAAAASRGQGQ